MLAHVEGVGLRMAGREADVFVQVERRDAGKIEAVAGVHRGQFLVKAQGRAAGREAEDGGGFRADERGNNSGRFSRGFPGGGCDDNFHGIKL